MSDVKLKLLSIATLMLLSACATNSIHDSCAAYRPIYNYLECPSGVVDQIDIHNITYDELCENEKTGISIFGFDVRF